MRKMRKISVFFSMEIILILSNVSYGNASIASYDSELSHFVLKPPASDPPMSNFLHSSASKSSQNDASDEKNDGNDASAANDRFVGVAKECAQRFYPGANSFVCVCNSTYCDEVAPVGKIAPGEIVVYSTTSDKLRLKRTERMFEKEKYRIHNRSDKRYHVEIRVAADARPRQTIFGFGGAFTDAAGINLNALSKAAREKVLESYFGENGIGYTVGRVPIASCDFSTREYSYLETRDDFDLRNFSLAREDLDYKIPHILKATKLSGGRLKLFASPWSAPGWMKTSGRMKGGAPLRGKLNGKYYRTYANYFVRFFEEYLKRDVPFWGLTIQNEPDSGLGPGYAWQTMYLSPEMQRDFARDLLVPALKASTATANLKVMAHDDQRSMIFDAAQKIFNSASASVIDGLGVHWYSKSEYTTLSKTHDLRPDKFILPTEACTGWTGKDRLPLLGDWGRGMEYATDIINNLLNWAVGWTDWNLVLDLQGGPNWVANFVDAPVIVNATADEFYKQPMFYVLAHFSKFIPRGSVRLDSDTLAGGAWSDAANGMTYAVFKTPRAERVLVILNEAQLERTVLVRDSRDNSKSTVIVAQPQSIHTVIWTAP